MMFVHEKNYISKRKKLKVLLDKHNKHNIHYKKYTKLTMTHVQGHNEQNIQQKQPPPKLKNINILTGTLATVDVCDTEHTYCSYISDKISEYIKNNDVSIPNPLLDRYFMIVCNNIYCWTLEYKKHLANVHFIFKNCKFDRIRIINNVKQNPEVIEILMKNSTEFDIQMMTKIPGTDNLFWQYVQKFVMSETTTSEILTSIINTAVSRKYYKSIDNILDSKVKIVDANTFDQLILGTVGKNDVDAVSIIKKCIANGSKIEKNTLKNFLKKVHIITTPYNFNNIVAFLYANGPNDTDLSITDILEVSCPNVYNSELLTAINNINDIGNIEITRDEFITMCNLSMKLKNYEKVKKYFTDNEIKKIIYINKIPYPIEFDYDIDFLRTMCLKSGHVVWTETKKILKKIKPDQQCMINACKTSNINLIKLLREEYNIPITEECVYASLNYFKTKSKSSNIVNFIANLYKIAHNIKEDTDDIKETPNNMNEQAYILEEDDEEIDVKVGIA